MDLNEILTKEEFEKRLSLFSISSLNHSFCVDYHAWIRVIFDKQRIICK